MGQHLVLISRLRCFGTKSPHGLGFCSRRGSYDGASLSSVAVPLFKLSCSWCIPSRTWKEKNMVMFVLHPIWDVSTLEKTPPSRSEACPGGISQGHKTVHFTCNVAPCMSFAPQSHKSQLKHPTLGPEIPLKVVALLRKTLVQMVQICPLQWKKRCFSQTVFLKNMFGAQ